MTVKTFEQIYKEIRMGRYEQRLRYKGITHEEWLKEFYSWKKVAKKML